jgi:hypothetical protein
MVASQLEEKLGASFDTVCTRKAGKDWSYHTDRFVTVEFELVEAAGDSNDVGYFEDRFEADPLFANVSILSFLGAESNTCQGFNLLKCESNFVTVSPEVMNSAPLVQRDVNLWLNILAIPVVVCILDQFEQKMGGRLIELVRNAWAELDQLMML